MTPEEYIKRYTRRCSNELVAVEDINGKKTISYHEWLTPENALSAVILAREELIEKVSEWIDKNAARYIVTRSVNGYKMPGLDVSITDDFRKAMED